MILKTISDFCKLFACASILAVGTAQAQEGESLSSRVSPEVRFIAAGIENSRTSLSCAQASVKHEAHTSKEYFTVMQSANNPPPSVLGMNQDEDTVEMGSWYYNKPQLAMVIPIGKEQGGELVSAHFSADETRAAILSKYRSANSQEVPPTDKFFYKGIISPVEVVMTNGLWNEWRQLDPRFYAYYVGDKPLDQLLLESPSPPIFQGEDVLYGSRCMKMQIKMSDNATATCWIDTEHNFLLRRYDVYLSVKGQKYLRLQIQAPQLIQDEGVHLPALVEIREFLPKVELPQYKDLTDLSQVFEARKNVVTISDFSSNCSTLPKDVFDLQFPLGTRVDDIFKQENYIVEKEKADFKEASRKDEN